MLGLELGSVLGFVIFRSKKPADPHVRILPVAEVNRNCKKNTTLFFGKRTTKNTKGRNRGTPDASVHRLHICCTMPANGSFAMHGNADV